MILQSGKHGHVRKIFPESGYGFVKVRDSGESVFFHVKDCLPALLAGGGFDESLLEREVAFDLCDGPKGPRAANVRPG